MCYDVRSSCATLRSSTRSLLNRLLGFGFVCCIFWFSLVAVSIAQDWDLIQDDLGGILNYTVQNNDYLHSSWTSLSGIKSDLDGLETSFLGLINDGDFLTKIDAISGGAHDTIQDAFYQALLQAGLTNGVGGGGGSNGSSSTSITYTNILNIPDFVQPSWTNGPSSSNSDLDVSYQSTSNFIYVAASGFSNSVSSFTNNLGKLGSFDISIPFHNMWDPISAYWANCNAYTANRKMSFGLVPIPSIFGGGTTNLLVDLSGPDYSDLFSTGRAVFDFFMVIGTIVSCLFAVRKLTPS
jgi:hypothetical protein